MSCNLKAEERADMLLSHVSGKLSAEAASRLDVHTKSCAGCASIVRTQSALSDALDAWRVPPVSKGFNGRVIAQWRAAQAAPRTDRAVTVLRDWFSPLFSRPAFPLAFAALILISGFVLDHRSKPVVALSASDVQQVETTLEDLDMLHQFDTSPAEQGKVSSSM